MKSRKVNGRRLQEVREKRGLSVPAFLDLLSSTLGRSVSKSMISQIENGKREPGAELFVAICEVLHITDSETVLLPAEGEAA
jgi:transcriptional regulator with XRE-family HTH domain